MPFKEADGQNVTEVAGFVLLQLYYFLNADLGHLADLVDRSVKIAGGPGNVLVNTQHLVEVK